VERRRTATATGLYDSFCHIFFLFTQFLITLFICVSKSLNDEERGSNCLLVPERIVTACCYYRKLTSNWTAYVSVHSSSCTVCLRRFTACDCARYWKGAFIKTK